MITQKRINFVVQCFFNNFNFIKTTKTQVANFLIPMETVLYRSVSDDYQLIYCELDVQSEKLVPSIFTSNDTFSDFKNFGHEHFQNDLCRLD